MTTLKEAQAQVVEGAQNGGVRCPCCKQFAKVYQRPINSSMARGLVAMFREYGTEFGSLPDVRRAHGLQNKDESVMRYWGLVEEMSALREDGGHAGWWRVTDEGAAFVRGDLYLPKYAHIYDGECMGFSGDLTSIRDALGAKFNLDELMAA